MADNGYVHTNTKTYWNSDRKILLFVLRVSMKGLNKLCLCPCTSNIVWGHEYPSMHGLILVVASWSRSELSKNPKSVGDHSYINTGMHQPLHFWPLILTPYISQPMVLPKKCHPNAKSYFFCTLHNVWNFLLKDPKLTGIWGKYLPFFRPHDFMSLYVRSLQMNVCLRLQYTLHMLSI